MTTSIELYLYVDTSSDMYPIYKDKANLHNNMGEHPDAGFDLVCPFDSQFEPNKSLKVDFGVTCAMYEVTECDLFRVAKPLSFFLYARSSISKTNFRLSNNVGIIDSGYRGTIGAYFDAYPWQNDNYTMAKGNRMVQLCAPSLQSFRVYIVDSLELLGETERGNKGFGSSGV